MPFDKNKAKTFGKTELLRLEHENAVLNRELAKSFAADSHNVLFISSAEEEAAAPGHFEYSGDEGVLSLKASVDSKSGKTRFCFLKYANFCRLLQQNSAVLSGLFNPDAVIFASVTPFAAAAAKKIASVSGAVLIAAVPCSYPEVFRRLAGASASYAVLTVLKQNFARSLRCASVFGYYPKLLRDYPIGRLIAPPPVLYGKYPGKEAVSVHDSVAAFSGDDSLRALIAAVKDFGKRFFLAIVGDGEYKSVLRRTTRECGAFGVCFYDGVPESDIPFVLSAADAVFVAESSVIKGNAAEYGDFLRAFSAKKPVIAAAQENAAFVKEAGGAVLALPENAESISKAISAVVSADKETRRLLGEACGEFAKKHNFNAFAEGFLSAVDSLVKAKEKQ